MESKQHGTIPPVIELPDGEEALSKPAFDIGSQDNRESDSGSDSDESDDEGVAPPTEAQVEAVRHVQACDRKDYRKILKLGPAAEDARQERENTLNSFNSFGCLLHPAFNKSEGAEEAWKSKLHIWSLDLATNLTSLVYLKAALAKRTSRSCNTGMAKNWKNST